MKRIFLAAICLAALTTSTNAQGIPFSRYMGGPPARGNNGTPSNAPVGASGITFSMGRLWIADSQGNQVRYVLGNVVTGFAGTGQRGTTGDMGLATAAQLMAPMAVTMDNAGYVWVLTGDGAAHLRYIKPDTSIWTLELPLGSLSVPVDILAAGNRLLIVDGSRIKSCPLPSTGSCTPTTVAGTGIGGFNGDGKLATETNIIAGGIALGSDGAIYFSDGSNSNRVRKFTIGGTVSTVCGGDGSLQAPRGLSVAPNGDVYVANWGKHAAERCRGNVVTRVLGTGFSNSAQQYCANPPCDALAQPFTNPTDVVFDAGTLYATSPNDGIVAVDVSGAVVTPIATNTVPLPTATNTVEVATATRTSVSTRTNTPLPTFCVDPNQSM